jgi:hypothetical protein
MLADERTVLGVLGEPVLCEGWREITSYGGWRAYISSRGRKLRGGRDASAMLRLFAQGWRGLNIPRRPP